MTLVKYCHASPFLFYGTFVFQSYIWDVLIMSNSQRDNQQCSESPRRSTHLSQSSQYSFHRADIAEVWSRVRSWTGFPRVLLVLQLSNYPSTQLYFHNMHQWNVSVVKQKAYFPNHHSKQLMLIQFLYWHFFQTKSWILIQWKFPQKISFTSSTAIKISTSFQKK